MISTVAHRILVIDDMEIARQTIAHTLIRAGFEVHERDTPLGATAQIVKLEIDAVVVDMNMPVMSGGRFAQVLRRNSRLDHVKLVLVTGDSQSELERVGRRIQADGMLSKEDVPTELVPLIRRLLGGSRA
jgi:CheY-like chemotaxis protein